MLRRIKSIDDQIQRFSFGNYDIPFYIDLIFKVKESERSNMDDQPSNNNSQADEGEKEIQELTQIIIDEFNLKGATNIFSKNEEVKTFSGIPAIKFFGTLDYPLDDQGEKARFNYSSYVFDFKSKSIILSILYEKDDRYALENLPKKIEELNLKIKMIESQLANQNYFVSDPEGFKNSALELEKLTKEKVLSEEEWLKLELRREEVEGIKKDN